MKIIKLFAFYFIKCMSGLAIGITFISCGGSNDHHQSVFHYNEATGIATLDPAFAKNQSIIWAVHQIYNTLVETDDHLKIIPSIARSWEVSTDRRRYTFHLRRDVFFQTDPVFAGGKGRRLSAKDVEYSFKRIIDKNVASSGAWIFNAKLADPDGFTALDDSTFQLKLARPFNPILGLLSMQYCSIVAEEAVEKYGKDFRSHPCGTGPFQLKSWEEGQDLILERNNSYFEKDSAGKRLPYLNAIKISFFDNKATEFLLFEQGELEFVNDIDVSFKDEVLNKKGELKKSWQNKIVLSKHPYLNTEYLGILVDTSNDLVRHSPLRFPAVRRAMNYGFDRRKMMMYLRNSIGIPAESGFVPAGLPSFDSSAVRGYHYDPSLARQLLREAGFPEGKNMPEIRLLTIDILADLAGFIAKELEGIGMKIKVDIVQKGLLLEETAKSQALFFTGSWIADYPDAENYLSVFYSKNPAPPNYTRYRNFAFDRLYELALTENNDSLKKILYQRMDQMMISEAPVIPLWYDEVIRLVNMRVKGFVPNSLNLLELRHVRLE